MNLNRAALFFNTESTNHLVDEERERVVLQRLVVLKVAVQVAGEGGVGYWERGRVEDARARACEVEAEQACARDATVARLEHRAQNFDALEAPTVGGAKRLGSYEREPAPALLVAEDDGRCQSLLAVAAEGVELNGRARRSVRRGGQSVVRVRRGVRRVERLVKAARATEHGFKVRVQFGERALARRRFKPVRLAARVSLSEHGVVRGRPMVATPDRGVVEVEAQGAQVFVEEARLRAVRQQLENGGRGHHVLARELAEKVEARARALGHGVAVKQRRERLRRALVRRAEHENLVDEAGAAPVGPRLRAFGREVSVAVHRGVASDEPAHRVGDDVEAKVGPTEPELEGLDASDEQARRLDVVATPVVREDVERVLIAAFGRVVPVALAVAAVVFERAPGVVVDVNFGRDLREPRRLDDARGDEVVAVRLKLRGRRQAQAVNAGAERRRPDDLARPSVHHARAEYARDDDDGALALAPARAREDAFEVRRAARAAARTHHR